VMPSSVRSPHQGMLTERLGMRRRHPRMPSSVRSPHQGMLTERLV
jgi:hypothetical protein